MAEEAMPVVLLRNRVPRPVGKFRIEKDDPGAFVPGIDIAPHVPVAPRIVARTARFLKPRMLIRGMVQHHLDDDTNAPFVRGVQECFEIVERSVDWVYRAVIGDIVPIVPQGRGKERHQPETVDPQILQVVQLLRQPAEIPVAISAAVVKSTDVDLVNNRVLVPKRVLSRQLSFPECGCVARTPMVRIPSNGAASSSLDANRALIESLPIL